MREAIKTAAFVGAAVALAVAAVVVQPEAAVSSSIVHFARP